MFPTEFNKFNEHNFKWFSQFSGMALLDWGFDAEQIKIVWQYQERLITGSIPNAFVSSSRYLNSNYRSTTAARYLKCDLSVPFAKRKVVFDLPEMRYLKKYPDIILHSWGFSNRLIDEIRETPDPILPRAPYWLKYTAGYTESPYSFQIEDPIPSVTAFETDDFFLDIQDIEEDIQDIEEDTTISSLTSDTVHDLQVKYQGTYGLYKDTPFIFTDVVHKSNSPHGYQICGYTYTENGSLKETIHSTEILECNMTLPMLGFINNDKAALFIERKHRKASPTRYRKGLRADNLVIINASAAEYKEAYNKPDPYDIYTFGEERVLQKILTSLFHPIFYTYEEALDYLLHFKKLSCAISSSLALSLDFKTNKILLHRNQFTIGIFNPKEKAFILKTDLFNYELTKAGVAIK